MKHIITAKNTSVTDSIKNYIHKRFSKFEKYVSDDTVVYTKIEVKENGLRHKVEVTIPFGKQTIRAEISDKDMYAAIDNVERIASRLLKKRKEKITQRQQAAGAPLVATEEPIAEYEVTRLKVHQLLSISTQEACEAMEMIGHPFYVYLDKDNNNKVCAVYLREDGSYGCLVYE